MDKDFFFKKACFSSKAFSIDIILFLLVERNKYAEQIINKMFHTERDMDYEKTIKNIILGTIGKIISYTYDTLYDVKYPMSKQHKSDIKLIKTLYKNKIWKYPDGCCDAEVTDENYIK